MEKILTEILKELQFQTKLLTNIFEDTDEKKFHANKMNKTIAENMSVVKKEILKHPSFQNNPEMIKMITTMLEVFPKGEGS